jgi:hypothetical protein
MSYRASPFPPLPTYEQPTPRLNDPFAEINRLRQDRDHWRAKYYDLKYVRSYLSAYMPLYACISLLYALEILFYLSPI